MKLSQRNIFGKTNENCFTWDTETFPCESPWSGNCKPSWATIHTKYTLKWSKQVMTSLAWPAHRPLCPDSPGTTVTSETSGHLARSGLCCLLCCLSKTPHPPRISVSSLQLAGACLRIFHWDEFCHFQDYDGKTSITSYTTNPNQVRVDTRTDNTHGDCTMLP